MIDEDALIREGMLGLLRGWGCEAVRADTDDRGSAALEELGRRPDAIISDYRLQKGRTGIEAIERLRSVYGPNLPALLISGDTAPEPLRDATASGIHLLHKPVQPMNLRALLSRILKSNAAAGTSDRPRTLSADRRKSPARLPTAMTASVRFVTFTRF